jgi:hypothetical protein
VQRQDPKNRHLKGGNNRLATLLLYLNDAETASREDGGLGTLERGGETNFHMRGKPSDISSCQGGLSVPPIAGSAVLFYNLGVERSATAAHETDENTWHAGCPVSQGVKWAANLWIYNQQPFYGKGGPGLLAEKGVPMRSGGGAAQWQQHRKKMEAKRRAELRKKYAAQKDKRARGKRGEL